MHQTRQLAAIMFTDVVGYTALMGEDEKKAFELLKVNRAIQKPLIEKFNGIWIKELGDGVLASFNTATNAVLCATEIQNACAETDNLKLRIGIHLGEIVFDNNDVFGDGVNIAARLQSAASVGSIWISDAVQKNISSDTEIPTRFVGEETLKHIKEPLRIYEVITKTHETESDYRISPTLNIADEKSIAVLPFINMSNDPEQEYFSDGVAEEILFSLANIKDLKIAAHTSSFLFKGKNIDLIEVAEKLQVRNVLEGSVRKQGNMLRITVQLINVHDGFSLWSERYDHTMENIFDIQDEIALAVTEKLKGTLLKSDREKISKSSTRNTEAYELYLKGRFYLARRGAAVLTALKCFEQAIEKDPDFALAHLGYADTNLLLATYGLVPAKLVMQKIKDAAGKALQLDASRCEPYCTLGHYYTCLEWDWKRGKESFLKCLEINSDYPEGHYRYAQNYLACVEANYPDAEKHSLEAIKLDPLSALCYAFYSLVLYTSGKFNEALDACKAGIELDTHSSLCHLNAGRIYMVLKDYDKSIASYEYAMQLSNRHHYPVNGLIWTYCLCGDYEKAHMLMNELKERAKKEHIGNTFIGLSAAYLNDLDEAFYHLEKAYTDPDPLLYMVKYEHWVPENLRNDIRFHNLLKRLNFPGDVVQ